MIDMYNIGLFKDHSSLMDRRRRNLVNAGGVFLLNESLKSWDGDICDELYYGYPFEVIGPMFVPFPGKGDE